MKLNEIIEALQNPDSNLKTLIIYCSSNENDEEWETVRKLISVNTTITSLIIVQQGLSETYLFLKREEQLYKLLKHNISITNIRIPFYTRDQDYLDTTRRPWDSNLGMSKKDSLSPAQLEEMASTVEKSDGNHFSPVWNLPLPRSIDDIITRNRDIQAAEKSITSDAMNLAITYYKSAEEWYVAHKEDIPKKMLQIKEKFDTTQRDEHIANAQKKLEEVAKSNSENLKNTLIEEAIQLYREAEWYVVDKENLPAEMFEIKEKILLCAVTFYMGEYATIQRGLKLLLEIPMSAQANEFLANFLMGHKESCQTIFPDTKDYYRLILILFLKSGNLGYLNTMSIEFLISLWRKNQHQETIPRESIPSSIRSPENLKRSMLDEIFFPQDLNEIILLLNPNATSSDSKMVSTITPESLSVENIKKKLFSQLFIPIPEDQLIEIINDTLSEDVLSELTESIRLDSPPSEEAQESVSNTREENKVEIEDWVHKVIEKSWNELSIVVPDVLTNIIVNRILSPEDLAAMTPFVRLLKELIENLATMYCTQFIKEIAKSFSYTIAKTINPICTTPVKKLADKLFEKLSENITARLGHPLIEIIHEKLSQSIDAITEKLNMTLIDAMASRLLNHLNAHLPELLYYGYLSALNDGNFSAAYEGLYQLYIDICNNNTIESLDLKNQILQILKNQSDHHAVATIKVSQIFLHDSERNEETKYLFKAAWQGSEEAVQLLEEHQRHDRFSGEELYQLGLLYEYGLKDPVKARNAYAEAAALYLLHAQYELTRFDGTIQEVSGGLDIRKALKKAIELLNPTFSISSLFPSANNVFATKLSKQIETVDVNDLDKAIEILNTAFIEVCAFLKNSKDLKELSKYFVSIPRLSTTHHSVDFQRHKQLSLSISSSPKYDETLAFKIVDALHILRTEKYRSLSENLSAASSFSTPRLSSQG